MGRISECGYINNHVHTVIPTIIIFNPIKTKKKSTMKKTILSYWIEQTPAEAHLHFAYFVALLKQNEKFI